MDGALQWFVSSVLQSTVLYNSYHPVLSVNPSLQLMPELIIRGYFWPHMVNFVHQVVNYCASYENTKGKTCIYR